VGGDRRRRQGELGHPRWNWKNEGFTDEREALDWFVPWTRASVSPGALVAEGRAFYRVDVRRILPSIHAPTLVVGLRQDEDWHAMMVQNPRFIAERIAGARLIEPPTRGGAWFPWYGQASVILEEVGTLLAGVRVEQASFDRVLATVLFTDIVDSTATAAELGDDALRALVERHHATVRALLARYRGVEVDTAGDGFFATFDGPARAVRCAQAIVKAVGPIGIEVRAGVHTGEVETIDGKSGGIAVAIGARVGGKAGASEVWVSSTVKDLVVGSGLAFDDAGEHELKGVPDQWHLYQVAG
jgi:class 3 adenylate cyclase